MIGQKELYQARAILRQLKGDQIDRLVELRKSIEDESRNGAMIYFADRVKKIGECIAVLDTFNLDMWARLEREMSEPSQDVRELGDFR